MIIVDVGANHGQFALDVAKKNTQHKIIAIEPIASLVDIIKEDILKNGIQNIDVVPVAIDIEARKATMNIASHHDWGVSSLLDFSELKLSDEYWSTRKDMYFDATQEVDVKPLSMILSEYDVGPENRIEFIKIDTQGLDLEVLVSARQYIQYIDAGMLEVSVNTALGLYLGERNDLTNVLDWLKENDFKPYKLKPNDHASNEFNLYFCKNSLNSNEVEKKLSLRGIDLYDGKFYWHFPSSKLLSVEEEYHNVVQENKELIIENNRNLSKLNNLDRLFREIDPTLNAIDDLDEYFKNKKMVGFFFKIMKKLRVIQ